MRRLLLTLTVVATLALSGSPAPARSGAPTGADVLILLGQTRIEEAAAMLEGVPESDPARGLALASLLYHRGRYDEAHDALVAGGAASPELEAAMAWLPRQIGQAKAATVGMLERTVGHFTYRFEPGADAILVEYASEALEGQRAEMERLLGVAPTEPTVVEFFPTVARFVQASGLPAEWVETTGTVAICKWDRILVLSPMNMARGYPWMDTLAHEYVHLALSRASYNEAPVWFHEGSAKLLESAWRGGEREEFTSPYAESLLAVALEEDALISFDQMHPSMAALPSADAATLAFAQVALAIDYILDEAGDEGYRRIVEQVRLHGDVLRAIDLVLGRSGRFEVRVRSHIEQQRPVVRRNVAGFEPHLKDGAAREPDDDGRALDPVLLADRKMQDLTRVGDLLRLRGHLEAALLEYEKAVHVGPFHSPALANKQARALRKLGREAEAVGVLRLTVGLYPEYTPTVSMLCDLSAAAGDDAAAIEVCRTSVGLNPFDPTVHRRLVELYDRAGRTEQAEQERRVLQLLGDHLRR